MSFPKRVMLFTNARDEKNIKEWAAHHLLIGFDLIVIFDHKSKQRISNQFINFDRRIKIYRCEVDGPIKLKLMMNAVNIANFYKADWFLYLDADEFLILNSFNGVKHMLSYYNHADSLAINWLLFGSNHHRKEPEGLILENYTKSDIVLDKHVKTFVRPNKVLNANNPHFYVMKDKTKMYNMLNQNINSPFYWNDIKLPYVNSRAYIAHYLYQSEETYLNRKINLPRDDTSTFRQKHENIHTKHNDIMNEEPKNKYAENINNFLNEKKLNEKKSRN
jgi:hypothetical protein